MKFSTGLLLAAQALTALALPAPTPQAASTAIETTASAATSAASTTTSAAVVASSASSTEAAAASTSAVAGGEAAEEGEENEIEQEAQFDTIVRVSGGNVKVDTLFPAGLNGVFEVELQSNNDRQLRVRENRNPAPPPAGFVALEPVSYRIELGGGARGLTLQKVDYILNANSTIDISQGQIGRFCRQANGFVIGAGVGELEFEVEENELTLTVDSLVGEWGIFVPAAAAAGAGAAAPAAGEGANAEVAAPIDPGQVAAPEAGCGPGTQCRAFLDAIRAIGAS